MTRSGIEQTPGVRIDWDVVRSRLRASERALDEAMTESPERIDAAYRARAARLAKGRAGAVPHASLSVMVFRLGPQRYAIEAKEVAEAVRPERCTPVPGSPPLFAGVINLRGELLAVLDPARLLALPEDGNRNGDSHGNGEPGYVLLLRRQGQAIGLKVDLIEGLGEVRPDELSLASQGKYVTGLAPGSLMLLSVDAMLAEVFSKERVR